MRKPGTRNASRQDAFSFVHPTSHYSTHPIYPDTMSSPALPPSATSPTQSRPIIDPLAFDNVRGLAGTQSSIGAHNRNRANGYDAEEAEEDNGDEGVRRARRGPTGVNVDDIPRVKDTTGEMVMESFALFLEKSVTSSSHRDPHS